jgi:hypothetical protein
MQTGGRLEVLFKEFEETTERAKLAIKDVVNYDRSTQSMKNNGIKDSGPPDNSLTET